MIAGNEFLSLWHRDSNMSSHSYSLHLYYSDTIDENLYAHSIKKTPVGQVIQTMFTSDSRCLVTLEQDNTTKQRQVRVWYNSSIRFLDKEQSKLFQPSKTYINNESEVALLNSVNDLEELGYTTIQLNSNDISYLKAVDFCSSFHAREEIMPAAFFAVDSHGSA